MRERLAAGPGDAEMRPLRNRHRFGPVRQHVIEALRHHDLIAPGLAGLPAVAFEQICRGSKDVSDRIDDIAPSVMVEVDGVTLEGRRHELRGTERACPRSLQVFRNDIASIEDLESRKKLLPKIVLSAANAGEGRGRAHHIAVADLRRVVRFDAPDRREHVTINAVGLFHRIELRLVGGEDFAAFLQPRIADQNVEIIPDRLGEFGLRIHQVHQAQVGRQRQNIAVIGRARDAATLSERPQPFKAGLEVGRGGPNCVSRH